MENKKDYLQLTYKNTTDEVKKVCCFEIFNKNVEGIEFTNSFVDGADMDYLKKYFYENPQSTSYLRILSKDVFGLQSERTINEVRKTPISSSSEPIISLIDYLNKHQFQNGILDVQYSFVLDGFSSDLEFDLLPNSSISISFFFGCSKGVRSTESLKELTEISNEYNLEHSKLSERVGSVIIENLGDEPKVIDINDIDKYNNIYSLDPLLKFSNVLYPDSCYFPTHEYKSFNSIRIVVTKSENYSNARKQVSLPIEFNSGSKYFPFVELKGTDFQSGINEINILGEEYSLDNPMRITVMAKTRVVYVFSNKKNLIPTTSNSKFINIECENITDSTKIINALSVKNEDGIKHIISKNKLSLSEGYFNPNMIKVFFSDKSQLNKEITFIRSEDNKSVKIKPCDYFSPSQFQSNYIEIPIKFGFSFNENDEILFELSKKGDGFSLVLFEYKYFNEYISSNYQKSLPEPVWIDSESNENV